MKNMKKTDILISVVLACLLIFSGVVQTSLKGAPQIVMLVWGGLTLLSLLMSQGRVANFMFTVLFGTLLAVAYFALIFLFTSWMSDPYIDSEGIRRHPMPTGELLLGFVGASVLTPFTISIYRKTHWHHRGIKIAASALFCAITAVVFIVTEVRYW